MGGLRDKGVPVWFSVPVVQIGWYFDATNLSSQDLGVWSQLLSYIAY